MDFPRRLKITGIINIGVGLGVTIVPRALIHAGPVYLCGLIPAFPGAATLVYVYILAEFPYQLQLNLRLDSGIQ